MITPVWAYTSPVNSVNTGISKRLNYHKKSKEFKNSPDEYISIEIIALIKLARLKGLDVTIDDAIVPMEIINSTNVEYRYLR